MQTYGTLKCPGEGFGDVELDGVSIKIVSESD